MKTIEVKTWDQLQDELFADSWNDDLQRFRSRFAFRGLVDSTYRLETTLMRLGGKYAELERHMLRNFKKYAHRNVVEHDSLWHWLSVAQHYGLPTRVLDWTYSPFIAMHFATADIDKFDRNGVIWAVDYIKAHKLLPPKLRDWVEREGANVLTVELLSEVVNSLSQLNALDSEKVVIFFEPPSIDDRIVNQYAFCSVMSDPCLVLDDWFVAHPGLCKRIIVPASLKWEIRDKLDQSNVNERVLFPGLDGLSRWLKRHYSPRVC
ncbi:MAG: FRG domain-containing protein [Desulfuromonadales bacterium]|nr:FRG domain-containing protein [Desulfuromonadales bacterium]